MQDRLYWLLGEKLKYVQNKVVLIIGLGGVGSYCLETLARTYFKKLIIVDGDKIDISNLNRQMMTNIDNVGLYKTDVFEQRIKRINPNCEIVKISEFITNDNLNLLFDSNPDYVIDCCDTIDTKVAIIKYCLRNKIKLISSMGMANRTDATKISITTLDKTSYDPLAKKLRMLLKKDNVKGKIKVVCSSEPAIKQKNLGSLACVTAQAGILCTNYVINDILEGVKDV